MKLLLDQGLPRSAAALLIKRRIETLPVGDIGMAAAEAREILARERQDHRIVVTLDADFHALLALSDATSPSVVRIRLEGLKVEGVVEVIAKVLKEWGEELELGAAVTVDERSFAGKVDDVG
ncbi:MAG: DUF5615 family PIN-like protein [Caldilineaceae bacterium]